MGYGEVYEGWRADPEAFWLDAARGIDWDQAPVRALGADGATWFGEAMVNGCWNAVDRHVEAGHGDRVAIVHDSPVTGTVSRMTYAELRSATARLAGALARAGIGLGDRVVVYMPMVPEALVAMLACARLGAIHSVVFGGFAAHELAVRIDDARPKAILAASGGIEPGRTVAYVPLIEAALAQAEHAPDVTVILERPEIPCTLGPHTVGWEAFQDGAAAAECVSVRGDHPAYILYTSGTTSAPKGVVRPTAGHLVALHWSMANIYGVAPGEVFWAASDVGWVVGHSYICYAPLLAGATTIVYEGKPVGTPDASAFWRVIADHGVAALFTAPTAFRAIKREDPSGRLVTDHDLGSLRHLFLAGERADPDTVAWAERVLGVPVIDHWWQTETGWAIAANPVGIETLPPRTGSPAVAMPGYEVRALSDDGTPLAPGVLGALAIRLPLPPGCLPTLWNADDRFRRAYLETFPGWYETGDAGMVDADGYVYVMARTDDVINVAGHRLSTGAMEEVLAALPDVAECAVVGVGDPLKGQVPVGFVCLNVGCDRPHDLIADDAVAAVRATIGPVAAFKLALVVPRLPKTRSGKILRGTMAAIADGRPWKMPATIDDPAILDEIAQALRAVGYPDARTASASAASRHG
ncbi:MAG: AMP-binding protein [Shimia sp.]